MKYLKISIVSMMVASLAPSIGFAADCSAGGGGATEAWRIACEQQNAARGKLTETRDGSAIAGGIVAVDLACSFIPVCAPYSGYSGAVSDKVDDVHRLVVGQQAATDMGAMAISWGQQLGTSAIGQGFKESMVGVKTAATDTDKAKDDSGMFRYNQKDLIISLAKKGLQVWQDSSAIGKVTNDANKNGNNNDRFNDDDNKNGPKSNPNPEQQVMAMNEQGGQGGSNQAGAASAPSGASACMSAKSAKAALDCIGSQSATIGNLLHDKKVQDAFKQKYGKDMGDFAESVANAIARDPNSVGNLIGGITGNSDIGNQVAKMMSDAANGKGVDSGADPQQKIASSNPSGTYKGAANSGGAAKKAGDNPLAGLNGLFDSLLGDPSKRDGADKNGHKIGLLDGRKNKLAGFGDDAWKNRDVSIFERVAVTYQDQISKNNWSLNDWGLASNALNHKDLKRAPASVP